MQRQLHALGPVMVALASTQCFHTFLVFVGLYGQSSMRLVRLDSGVVEKSVPLASQYFGEGAARLGNKIYQITWLTNTGFIYAVPSLRQVRK